ncbi:hypothetical protein [Acetobacteroides hydrogenigenes]|uniref:ASCH domain-containing protein n=1 Tax=Acetobacteroides hydrogenigenes TaxID=979970 RepID=A0A4R2EAG7_9BACT|nr:hypothetical protein [Acetobacteroides hydrogenigenes]TCN63702.1 hypothetical protein CLV25_11552 [Acetobacteroides hydrogenigenes]
MLMTFSKLEFKTWIEDEMKIHSIREDKHGRWKPGMLIHMWMGTPRNTRGKVKPYQFDTKRVVSIQRIEIRRREDAMQSVVKVDGRVLDINELKALSWNDGFTTFADFWDWFREDFTGKIVHWTDKRY